MLQEECSILLRQQAAIIILNKCGGINLQQMLELPSNYPNIYKSFRENGYHAIRRSNRYWARLWSDLVIEQVMIK